MAETLVLTINFSASNPEGTYVAGDTVTVYYDKDLDPTVDAASGLSVKLNGLAVTSGSDINFLTKSYKTVKSSNTSICNGTTLVSCSPINSSFPYVTKIGLHDSPSCAAVPENCDLMVVGAPLVRGSTTDTSSDGEVTVVAMSSQVIQYRLDLDFVYNDGTAQSSGHFFCSAGDHRVFVRDAHNCTTTVFFTVPVDDTYSPIYTLEEYVDRLGNKTKVEIQKRAYTGSTTFVKGGPDPIVLSLRGEADDNKFTPLLQTEAVVTLASETNFQFAGLFTNKKEHRIVYSKDYGNTLPDFTPASLPALSSWSDDGVGSAWNNYHFAILIGKKSTSKKYTLYSFVAGETYSFNYSFYFNHEANGWIAFVKMIVEITNASGADLGVNTTIFGDLSDIGGPAADHTYSGTITFVAPAGADRIKIYCSQSAQYFEYDILSFTNATSSHANGQPVGYEQVWIGDVLPQQFQEEYKNPPYYTEVTAKDGLSDLQNIYFFQDDGQQFFGRVKTIKMIALCLSKIGLKLPIRVACNIYATTMDTGDADDPLDQAYKDPYSYYQASDSPTFDFVLSDLLKTFRARLVLWNNRWNITRIEEAVGSYDYRDFDKDGIYLSNGTYNPLKDVNKPSVLNSLKWRATPNMELRPGCGIARVVYHLGLKDNILLNGDFRLSSIFNPITNGYSYSIDKTGWQLVSPYPISESAEIIEGGPNVAYVMATDSQECDGEAYIQSNTYSMSMGLNNSLKIRIRCKVPSPVAYGVGLNDSGNLVVFLKPATLYYQKVRLVVKFGALYLQSDGSWEGLYSEYVFYVTKFDEYNEFEVIAQQPSVDYSSTHDFYVRVYHSFGNQADNYSLAEIKAIPTIAGYYIATYDASSNLFPSTGGSGGGGAILKGDKWEISVAGILGGVAVVPGYNIVALVNSPGQTATNWFVTAARIVNLPVGTKTEMRLGPLMSYYELEENDSTPDDDLIIRPDDYNSRDKLQWIKKGNNDIEFNPIFPFSIDYVSVQVLTDGQKSVDTIIREIACEPNNNTVIQEDLYSGSLAGIIETNILQGISIPKKLDILTTPFQGTTLLDFFPRVSKFLITTNSLPGSLIYSGYFSDSDGVGYESWAREGISEAQILHYLCLLAIAGQYGSSFRKISGGLEGDIYMGFINTLREVQQENLLYLPMSLKIHDKDNSYDGEFLELKDTSGDTGAGFTKGFTIGFDA